jgi:hypothetical protein
VTVIAWDGKTLAGDKQRNSKGTAIPSTKIHEIEKKGHGRIIFGCSGDAFECDRYVRWAKGLEPKPPTLSDISILSIDADRRIWVADHRLYWCQVNMPFWSIGCGADFALATLHLGHTAKRAIEVACELDNLCGMGIDELEWRS